MASIGPLVQSAQALVAVKCVFASGAVLTLYDYLLMFGDEIQYVWRGRKTWIFYFYMLNRVLLITDQFWQIHHISSPRSSENLCFARLYIQTILGICFSLSSEIFIALRIYAITFRNKILAGYFGGLALTRFALTLASNLIKPATIVALPPIPIDPFKLCGYKLNLQFALVPMLMGTVFDLTAFIVIVWSTYRNRKALRFSALVRTIVAEATIYFIAMLAAQTYIQLSYSLMEGTAQNLSFAAYGALNPVLTMRFAVSLKKSADPGGGQEWSLKHFSSVEPGGLPPDSQGSAVREDIEMESIGSLDNRMQTTRKTGSYSATRISVSLPVVNVTR